MLHRSAELYVRNTVSSTGGLPNKGMKLTKLRGAPVRQPEVPPCARSVQSGAGTASQLIPGVRRTEVGSNITERGARIGPRNRNAIGPNPAGSHVT